MHSMITDSYKVRLLVPQAPTMLTTSAAAPTSSNPLTPPSFPPTSPQKTPPHTTSRHHFAPSTLLSSTTFPLNIPFSPPSSLLYHSSKFPAAVVPYLLQPSSLAHPSQRTSYPPAQTVLESYSVCVSHNPCHSPSKGEKFPWRRATLTGSTCSSGHAFKSRWTCTATPSSSSRPQSPPAPQPQNSVSPPRPALLQTSPRPLTSSPNVSPNSSMVSSQ